MQAEESLADIHVDPESTEINHEIRSRVFEFEDVATDLPLLMSLAKCEVRLLHNQPIHNKQFPLPFTQWETIGKEVKSMLDMDVIEPSTSPYISPIVLVEKKDEVLHRLQEAHDLRR